MVKNWTFKLYLFNSNPVTFKVSEDLKVGGVTTEFSVSFLKVIVRGCKVGRTRAADAKK